MQLNEVGVVSFLIIRRAKSAGTESPARVPQAEKTKSEETDQVH